MLFRILIVISAVIQLQTVFAKQSSWSFKKPLHESGIANRLKQNMRQTAQRKLYFKKLNSYRKGWCSPEFSYLSISHPTEHNIEQTESTASSSDSEQPNTHKLITILPWWALQGAVQYRLSEDVYIQGAGLVYLSRRDSNGVQFTPAESPPEKSVESQGLPSTPTKASSTSDSYFSPNTSSLYRNAWADNSSTPSVASFQSKEPSVVSNTPAKAKQSVDCPASTSPSSVHNPLSKPIYNNAKQYFGVGGVIASQHTFLNPHFNCLFYWSPSLTLLYPVNYDTSSLISLSVGIGFRWKINSKITIEAAGAKALKTWGTDQELRFIKLGFQYNTG